jgi:Oxidoreductase FAD-binding domain
MLTRCVRQYSGHGTSPRGFQPTAPRRWNRPTLILHTRSRSIHELGAEHAHSGQPSRRPVLPIVLIALAAGSTGLLSWYLQQNSADTFSTLVLVKKEPVSATASIFHLEPKGVSGNLQIYEDAWKKGIWNLQVKQPQIQVVRPYTPLPPGDHDGSSLSSGSSLRFLIRAEKNGEVSGWLHRIPVGSEIELRGPNLEYAISTDTRQIIFLAGGTGIASALQAAHAMLQNRARASSDAKDPPRISILWANRTRDDCVGGLSDNFGSTQHSGRSRFPWISSTLQRPGTLSTTEKGIVVKELEALKERYPGQVTVDYFVDNECSFIDKSAVAAAVSTLQRSAGSNSERPEIIISGPEGFITYLAGPKEWRNGRQEQGPVQGVISQALQTSSHPVKVWKV